MSSEGIEIVWEKKLQSWMQKNRKKWKKSDWQRERERDCYILQEWKWRECIFRFHQTWITFSSDFISSSQFHSFFLSSLSSLSLSLSLSLLFTEIEWKRSILSANRSILQRDNWSRMSQGYVSISREIWRARILIEIDWFLTLSLSFSFSLYQTIYLDINLSPFLLSLRLFKNFPRNLNSQKITWMKQATTKCRSNEMNKMKEKLSLGTQLFCATRLTSSLSLPLGFSFIESSLLLPLTLASLP